MRLLRLDRTFFTWRVSNPGSEDKGAFKTGWVYIGERRRSLRGIVFAGIERALRSSAPAWVLFCFVLACLHSYAMAQVSIEVDGEKIDEKWVKEILKRQSLRPNRFNINTFKQSGRVKIRVPAAAGKYAHQISNIESLFTEGRLEDGFASLRRLLREGDRALFPVSKGPHVNRFLAVDKIGRSILTSLSLEERKQGAQLFKALSEEIASKWLKGSVSARNVLSGELPMTEWGKRALSDRAGEYFEAGLFQSAADTWSLILNLEGGDRTGLLEKIGLASLLHGDYRKYEEALSKLKTAGSSPGGRNRLQRWAEAFSGPENRTQTSSLSGGWCVRRGFAEKGHAGSGLPVHRSAFDPAGKALLKAPFMHGTLAWRTPRFLWSVPPGERSMVPGPPCRYAVSFEGSLYATDGLTGVYGFSMKTGKLARVFPGESGLAFRPEESVERVPKSVVVSESYVLAPLVVRVETPSAFMHYSIKKAIPYRGLFVFAREGGTLIWRSDKVEDLADLSVVGMPLVRDGVVYLAGWLKKGFVNIYVAAVELASGRVLWRRLICGSQLGTTMFGEMAYEPFGVTLSGDGEHIFAATNMGTAASLRLSDGSIRWLTSYESIPVPIKTGRLRESGREIRWADNPAFVKGGSLYLAPRDSEDLLKLSCSSGRIEKTWKSRSTTRYLLGFANGNIIVSGGKGLFSLDPETLKGRRLLKVNSGRRVRGRPGLTEEGVYFCLVPGRSRVVSRRQIHRDGRKHATGKWESPGLCFYSFETHRMRLAASPEGSVQGGNICVTDCAVLVTSNRFITAYCPAEAEAP